MKTRLKRQKKSQKKKLRILAASDIHGDTKLAKRLAEKAKKEKVDLVILSGDLTFAEMSTKGIIGPFAKAKEKVLLIPGNHETVATTNFLAELYGATNLHGYSIKIGDVGIFGCGGANIGPFEISEKDISYLLKKSHQGIKKSKKTIMVTHVHPAGSKGARLSHVVPGSSAVKDAIKKFKPDIAICGHVHEAEGLEEKLGKTKLINVGRKGKIIEI
ncbi:metallophosphoesterase [Candidatus Pacearchaeota archaeon ex4484_26]|nr:MAG: metallophosphoesterase [Candidatus Pacearchaeota archaeon ex4484_26]